MKTIPGTLEKKVPGKVLANTWHLARKTAFSGHVPTEKP